MLDNKENKQVDQIVEKLSSHLGKSPDELKASAKTGDFSNTFENINPKDANKIKKVLSDKNLTSRLLSSDIAKKLLKTIMGNKKKD